MPRLTRTYAVVRDLIRFDLEEQARLVGHLLRWIALGAVSGVLAGLASAGFLESLDWITNLRLAHPWLLFLLPAGGFAIGLAYHYGGGRSASGNSMIIDEIHDPKDWISRRMAPLIYVGTLVTQLFGGSVGREGTAIQMSGSLTDAFSRIAHLSESDRRMMLIAAIAAGFGSVFGVPLAGCVFALEVQAVGRMRYDALVPALSASVVGDMVVRAVGVHHTAYPQIATASVEPVLLLKVALAGLLFGLCSVAFCELTHGIERLCAATLNWPPVRPVIGGVAVVAMTYLVGNRDYLGLSLPLITRSFEVGVGVATVAFALKLVFTSVTLGSGFQGGEVTPLFVMGATLGATLGHLLGVSPPLMAAVGFVAVFAGAANTPLACTVMGLELFGTGIVVPLAIGCVVSYVFSAQRGIYGTQRVDTPKGGLPPAAGDAALTINVIARARRQWLPTRSRSDPPADSGPAGG